MPYAIQLWTIPVELQCSFITWIGVLGLSNTRPLYRMITMGSISLYLFMRSHHPQGLFIAGATLAELYLQLQESTNALPVIETSRQKVKHAILFTIAVFFLSYPSRNGSTTLGFSMLDKLGGLIFEKSIHWPHTGAVLLVYTVSQSPLLLQPVFSTIRATYLGKVSFALYCVHVPILNWIGWRVIMFWWTSPLGENLGFVVAFAILFIITILAADVFMRAVDEPSVKLARWLENIYLDPSYQ
jgi:peptidoglycan/LPS O-acetylase OafA/YrhL